MDDIKVGRRFFLKSGGTAAAAMGAAVIPIHNANAAPATAAGSMALPYPKRRSASSTKCP